MTKTRQYHIETKVYLNEILSDMFVDIDNQMFLSCGQDECQS